jgi:ATP-binding cassette subfamily B protein/subfamily B ATP-binding cassette protein MsbA
MAIGTVGCAVLSLAFAFVYPKLIQFVVDEVIGKRQGNLLMPAMLGLLGAFLLRDLFNSLRIRINNTFEQNVIYDMRRAVYARRNACLSATLISVLPAIS